MKKSNALMLSYILVLLVTVIVSAEFEWHGIDQVALATTMAGFFFAIADYFGWEASYNQHLVDAKKEYLNTYRFYLNEVLSMANKDSEEIQQAIDLLNPYLDSHESVAEVLDTAKELADTIDQAKTNASTALLAFPKRMEAVSKKERKIKNGSFVEAIGATAGFFVFFLFVIFDSLAAVFMPASSVTTVAAFAIIMLNYLAKDLLEGKMQKDVSESAALCREMKQKATDYKEKLHQTRLLENARKMVSNIEEYLSKEEDVDNG